MNHAAAVFAPVSGQVHDLLQHRLERALRERVRYRYVTPNVLREGTSYRIQSPCCSRTVDPSGGVIDIALLVPHQANIRIIEATAQRLHLPMSKVYVNIERYGNTSGATIPIALDEAIREGRAASGDVVLLDAFGAVFTWGSALLRW